MFNYTQLNVYELNFKEFDITYNNLFDNKVFTENDAIPEVT